MDEVTNGDMAVCSDIGFKNDVHPTNKKDVGERLARGALNKTYHVNIVPSGPLPLKAVYKNGVVVVSFQYANDLKTFDGKTIRGFSLDGTVDADAIIQHDKIIIPAKGKPGFIYYARKPFTDANLVNADKLPESTFKKKCNENLKAPINYLEKGFIRFFLNKVFGKENFDN